MLVPTCWFAGIVPVELCSCSPGFRPPGIFRRLGTIFPTALFDATSHEHCAQAARRCKDQEDQGRQLHNPPRLFDTFPIEKVLALTLGVQETDPRTVRTLADMVKVELVGGGGVFVLAGRSQRIGWVGGWRGYRRIQGAILPAEVAEAARHLGQIRRLPAILERRAIVRLQHDLGRVVHAHADSAKVES